MEKVRIPKGNSMTKRKKASAADDEKREAGRFYTREDVFSSPAFWAWLSSVPGYPRLEIAEPFAGACHIPAALTRRGVEASWRCFDIAPADETENGMSVETRDTLADYPKGFVCAITNPPYLAKNSARRRGLSYPDTAHDDLYKLCLDVMLSNTDYVAAIIPESFLTQGLFEDRLTSVVSLIGEFFDDTECPVCLAMFAPKEKAAGGDFEVWRNERLLGRISTLRAAEPKPARRNAWKFNDPQGELAIFCCDSPKGASIRFGKGPEIPSSEIKHTSRALTRVGGLPEGEDLDALIARANAALAKWREATSDVTMTSFKGLREDGAYRRRLDFAAARNILDASLSQEKASIRAVKKGEGSN